MFKKICFGLIVLLIACFYSNISFAQNISYRLEKSKVRMLIPPGTSQSGSLKVYNMANEELSFKVYFEDWEYEKLQDGSKEFYPIGSTRFSCAQWIQFSPAELTVPPYGVAPVNYVVTVPADAKGSAVAVMFFESSSTQPGIKIDKDLKALTSGVSLNVRIGSLFYVDVQDTVKRTAALSKFNIKRDPKNKYYIISADFKNTGNADIDTETTYAVTDNNGMVYARGKFNQIFTLPGDTAQLNTTWKEPIPQGTFTIVLTINLGKAIEEADLGRGPIMLQEAIFNVNANGEIAKVGDLK